MRDLHRLRFGQTIAGAIRSDAEAPAQALRSSMARARVAAALPAVSAAAVAVSAPSSAPIHLTLAPVIHISAAVDPAAVERAVSQALRDQADVLLRRLQEAQARKERKTY